MHALLLAALFALLPPLAHASCPDDICVGGDAEQLFSMFTDADTYMVHGTGDWEMDTRGTSYEYVTHFYFYNDSATTHTIDTVDFYFLSSDWNAGQSGACNWSLESGSTWFSACDIYICLSDAYQSYCQELAVDAVQWGTGARHARFEGFASVLLEAYGSLAIDLVYEPTGSGSISPGVTSLGETVYLNFQ